MVVVCGGLLQPRHLPILSAPGWDTRQPGPRHSDNDCMWNCRLWISSGRRNRIFTCNFVRIFLFMFLCSENFNIAILYNDLLFTVSCIHQINVQVF